MDANKNLNQSPSQESQSVAQNAIAPTPRLSKELIEKLSPLLDRYGLVHDRPNRISGNGLLYSAHVLLSLWQNNLQWEEWEARLPDAIQKCEIVPGFFHRHPTEYHEDQQGPDDYIGVASLCALLGPFGFFKSNQVLSFGWKGFPLYPFFRIPFYFPNEKQYQEHFGHRALLLKFPAVFVAFYGVARRCAWLPFRLYWSASVLIGDILDRKHKHDPWILNWHLVNIACKFYLDTLEIWTIKIWLKRLRKRWPGGISQCLEESFQYRHPVCELALDICPEFQRRYNEKN